MNKTHRIRCKSIATARSNYGAITHILYDASLTADENVLGALGLAREPDQQAEDLSRVASRTRMRETQTAPAPKRPRCVEAVHTAIILITFYRVIIIKRNIANTDQKAMREACQIQIHTATCPDRKNDTQHKQSWSNKELCIRREK